MLTFRSFFFSTMVTVLAFSIGCGEGSTPVAEQPAGTTVSDLIKRDLQMVADSGRLGSEMMSIQNNLEKLKVEEPAKAEKLEADLEELRKASGSKVKAKAQQMIDQL